MPIDDRTTNRSYKLPNAGNYLADDVLRLRDALNAIDADVYARYTKTEVDALIANLINGAPGALDTLNELAAALGDDSNFAATVTTALNNRYTKAESDARYMQGVTQTENVFTGNGSQTTFTLTQEPPTRESLLVTVDGVVQPTSEYNLTGATLTLSEAPASGANIRVLMLGVAGPVQSASTLSFSQSGAGAVQRTVESKLKDVVSVKDFGAVGNGVADDTAAIQAAIASVSAAGRGTVFLPAGIYLVSNTISITASNVFIRGDGMWNTIITRNSTAFSDTIRFKGGGTNATLLVGLGISELTIRSTGLMSSGSHLRLDGVTRFDVHSIYAENGFSNFTFQAATAGRISNTYSLGTNLYGGSGTGRYYVKFTNSADSYTKQDCGDVFIDNFNWRANTSNQLYNYGLWIESADGLWFSNGHIGNTTSANILIDSNNSKPLNLVFFNNVMSDEGTLYSCLIQGSTSVDFETIRFTGCEFKSGGNPAFCRYGVVVAAGCTVDELQFSNCVIQEFGDAGVSLNSTVNGNIVFADCIVKGNGRTFTAPGYSIVSNARAIVIIGGSSGRDTNTWGTGLTSYGILVGGGATNILINGVDLTGNATGPLSLGPTAAVEINNCILGAIPTVASASTLDVPAGYRYCYLSGTTTINNIQVAQPDRIVTLIFTNTVTVKDAVGNIKLNGDFAATADDSLTLLWNGTNWIELARSAN